MLFLNKLNLVELKLIFLKNTNFLKQKKSEEILNENQELLHSMAKSLLKHETIDAKDIQKLLDGKKIIRRKPSIKSSKSSNGKVKSTSSTVRANGKF